MVQLNDGRAWISANASPTVGSRKPEVGSSGGRSSKTSTVIRTANTPSENALSRSGVALWSMVVPFPFSARRGGLQRAAPPLRANAECGGEHPVTASLLAYIVRLL